MKGIGKGMENIILIGIIIACLVFILICVIKRKPSRIVDFGLRASIGTAGIYLLDLVLRMKGFEINVGINGVSVLTNGLLGLPGFILLYGLAFYYSTK
jgi:inhibitor of the pro-sigma K processing machinery